MTEDEEMAATYELARKIVNVLDRANSNIVIGALAVCTVGVLATICPTREIAHEGADRFAASLKKGITLRTQSQNKTPN